MISVDATYLVIEGGPTFLTAWIMLSLLVLAVTFAIMLRATYIEWKNGMLW